MKNRQSSTKWLMEKFCYKLSNKSTNTNKKTIQWLLRNYIHLDKKDNLAKDQKLLKNKIIMWIHLLTLYSIRILCLNLLDLCLNFKKSKQTTIIWGKKIKVGIIIAYSLIKDKKWINNINLEPWRCKNWKFNPQKIKIIIIIIVKDTRNSY